MYNSPAVPMLSKKSIIMKMLYTFGLRFRNSQLEAEYIKIANKSNFLFYIVALFILLTGSILVAVLCFRFGESVHGFVLIGVALGVSIMILLRNKLKKIIAVIVFLMGQLFFLGGLWYIDRFFPDLPIKTVFYEGFAFGLLSTLLQQLFPRFEIKLLFTIGSMLSRYIVVTPKNYPGVLANTVFDIAVLLILYHQERRMRELFQGFHEYRKEHEKFKALLTHHLPENIAIFNKNLDKVLFVNNSFSNNFKTKSVNRIKEILSKLKVSLETLNQGTRPVSELTFNAIPDPTLLDYLQRCKKNSYRDGSITNFNVIGPTSDENQVTYEAKVFQLKWDETDAVTVMLNDLTQQETILALKLADENKDRVLATVSHELRTPINGMLGVVQIMENEFQDPKILSYCKTAKICCQMLLNLVNSILDLSQIRHNCIKLNPISFNIEDLFEEVESMFRTQMIGKVLEFKVIIEEGVPKSIVSDRNRLMQIIINLLANSLKFTFEGSITLKATSCPGDNEVKFSIEDTGIGIKEEDKPRLFKMFGRIEQANTKINTQGVGLGLTIANSLVKLLNPDRDDTKIEFDSQYGSGSSFSFIISTRLSYDVEFLEEEITFLKKSSEKFIMERDYLGWYTQSVAEFPQTDQPFNINNTCMTSQRSSQRESLIPINNSLKSLRIRNFRDFDTLVETSRPSFYTLSSPHYKQKLISSDYMNKNDSISSPSISEAQGYVLAVDDNPLNLLVASKLLEKRGFKVITAFNGKDAIEKAKAQEKEHPFKMILMDCQMPVMDGYEATRNLRELMQKNEILEAPIFALTANDTKKDQEECMKAGMTAHLTKPLRDEMLKKIVDKYLTKYF